MGTTRNGLGQLTTTATREPLDKSTRPPENEGDVESGLQVSELIETATRDSANRRNVSETADSV